MKILLLSRYQHEISCGLAFLAVFAAYSNYSYLRTYPGYFLLQILSMVLIILWLSKKNTPSINAGNSLLLYPCLLLIWAILTVAWAAHAWIVFEGLRRLTTICLLMIGLGQWFCRCLSLHRNFWNILLGIQGFLGTIYAIRILCDNFRIPARFGFPYGNPNIAGAVLGSLCAFAALRFMHAFYHRYQRSCAINGIAMVILAITVIICGSKGALLATIAAIAASVCIFFGRYRAWLVVGTVAILIGVGYSKFLAHGFGASVEIRLFIWQGTISTIIGSWWRCLLGWGPGNFFANFPDFQDPRIFATQYHAPVVHYPHNFFLETWVEYGSIGLVLLLFFIGRTLLEAWKQANVISDCKHRRDACGVFAMIIMLFLHSQISVAMSYPQVQLFWASAVAWLACGERKDNNETKGFCSKRVVLGAMLPLCLCFAKYWSWDSLVFHIHYRKASMLAKQAVLTTAQEKPRRLAKAMRVMHRVPVPVCENYYTCSWRRQLGSLSLEYYQYNPNEAQKALTPFLQLDMHMPKFSYYLLNRAILAAKQKKTRKMQYYFKSFAAVNPFYPYLWTYWALACKYDCYLAQEMLVQALKFQKLYGADGVLLLGEALARDLLGQKQQAYDIMSRVYQWSKSRPGIEKRAQLLKNIAGYYLFK